MFLINYYIIGYRRKEVLQNLQNAFPEKSEKEIKEISRKFFHNFCDYLAEMIKGFTISQTESRVRMQHLNQHLFQQAKDEGKNVIMLSGHVFNWEWFNALSTLIPQKNCYPVYRKISNSFWEDKIKFIRNRFNNQSLEANDVIKHIFRNQNDGNSVYMFVADQTPNQHSVSYGLKFLNQKTPAFVGYDKLSTRMDMIFIYCEMKKVKRGFYQVNYYRIYPDGEKFVEHEVVRKFHKLLENTIHKRPDNWLWSHRRWKYKDYIKKYDE